MENYFPLSNDSIDSLKMINKLEVLIASCFAVDVKIQSLLLT